MPLRGGNDSEVLLRICGVLDAIPESERDPTPIHAFGISGNLTPILAYLGVDSFDSTSYIQSARNLGYSEPETQRKLKIMELNTMDCTCRVCRETSLEEMQQAFMEAESYRRTSTGKYKSEYYAAIALHNFEMEAETLRDMKDAITGDDTLEALVRHASTVRGVREAVDWLAENDDEFAVQMSRTAVVVPKRLTSRRTYQTNSYQLVLFTCAAPLQTDLFLHEEQPTISRSLYPLTRTRDTPKCHLLVTKEALHRHIERDSHLVEVEIRRHKARRLPVANRPPSHASISFDHQRYCLSVFSDTLEAMSAFVSSLTTVGVLACRGTIDA